MVSEKPWKSEAILRLGLSLFLCQFVGFLALAVARYFAGPRSVGVWIFCALAAASAASCGAALIALRKPWELERFTRRFLWLIFFIYLGLTFGAFASHFAGPASVRSSVRTVVAALGFQGVALVLMPGFLREHGLGWNGGFGFHERWPRAVGYGVLAACGFLPVAIGLRKIAEWSLQRLDVPVKLQPAVEALQDSSSWLDAAAIGVVAIALAPVAEEMLFRGILYPAVKLLGFPRLAVLGTAVLFAVVHFNIATFLPLLVLALVLTWLYEETGNLLAPIAAHLTFNALQFAMFYLLPLFPERINWLPPLPGSS